MAKRILRPAESQARLGIGHSQFYEWIRTGRLSQPVRLGPQSVGHTEDEIDAVIDQLVAERDFRIRLLQELSAAQSVKAAAAIYERAQPKIDSLEPHAAEQLHERAADLIRELRHKFEKNED